MSVKLLTQLPCIHKHLDEAQWTFTQEAVHTERILAFKKARPIGSLRDYVFFYANPEVSGARVASTQNLCIFPIDSLLINCIQTKISI